MTGHEPGPVNPRFPLFDSLRAIAALCIFAVHLPFAYQMSADDPLRPYLLELNVGVAVFFLISGFLLYRPFARARLTGDRRPGTAAYAGRRVLRIVPAYWVALPAVVLLIGPAGQGGTSTPVFSWDGFPAYFGFAQVYDSSTALGGISAAWSLCVEVTFYALLPLWAMLLRRIPCRSSGAFLRSELLALTALAAIGVGWTAVWAARANLNPAAFFDVTQNQPWRYVLPGFLDHFAAGMALAVVSVWAAERPSRPRVLRAIERAPWLPWLVAAAAYAAIGQLGSLLPNSWAGRYLVTHELQAVVALGLLLPAVFGDPRRGLVRRLLSNRALLWLGLVSYGLFLWHAAIIRRLGDEGALDSLGSVGFTAVALALSLAAAAASFYVVERPALRLGRRLSRRRRSQDADVRMRDLGRHERPQPGLP